VKSSNILSNACANLINALNALIYNEYMMNIQNNSCCEKNTIVSFAKTSQARKCLVFNELPTAVNGKMIAASRQVQGRLPLQVTVLAPVQ
jgi:hypothetical protein